MLRINKYTDRVSWCGQKAGEVVCCGRYMDGHSSILSVNGQSQTQPFATPRQTSTYTPENQQHNTIQANYRCSRIALFYPSAYRGRRCHLNIVLQSDVFIFSLAALPRRWAHCLIATSCCAH